MVMVSISTMFWNHWDDERVFHGSVHRTNMGTMTLKEEFATELKWPLWANPDPQIYSIKPRGDIQPMAMLIQNNTKQQQVNTTTTTSSQLLTLIHWPTKATTPRRTKKWRPCSSFASSCSLHSLLRQARQTTLVTLSVRPVTCAATIWTTMKAVPHATIPQSISAMVATDCVPYTLSHVVLPAMILPSTSAIQMIDCAL